MKTLKINESIEISELLKRRKTDKNKYVFEYYQDIAWDDLDENAKNLNISSMSAILLSGLSSPIILRHICSLFKSNKNLLYLP